MPFIRKRIQLVAISPERGHAYVRYGDSDVFSIGPPSFRPQSVQKLDESQLQDFFTGEELVVFESTFNSWRKLTKYLQKLYVKSNQALLTG